MGNKDTKQQKTKQNKIHFLKPGYCVAVTSTEGTPRARHLCDLGLFNILELNNNCPVWLKGIYHGWAHHDFSHYNVIQKLSPI